MNKIRDLGYLKDIKESIELINSYLEGICKCQVVMVKKLPTILTTWFPISKLQLT